MKRWMLGFLLVSSPSLAAHYEVDQVHSRLGFVAKHLAVSRVTGNFKDFTGSIDFIPEDLKKSQVDFVVQAASINTDFPKRDAHLRSEDFLSADKYPTLTFKSTAIRRASQDRYAVTGELKIRGVKKTISLEVQYTGRAQFGQDWRAGFHASFKINRKDFGMKFHKVLDTGGMLVSEEVDIQLDIEAIEKSRNS